MGPIFEFPASTSVHQSWRDATLCARRAAHLAERVAEGIIGCATGRRCDLRA
jgi:hypothetical protein